MSQHRKHRGMRTQKLIAQYLAARGWPYADTAGAGRPGSDITGTIDIAVEVKARTGFNPLAWVRQAETGAKQERAPRLPFAVMRCNGQGEDPSQYITLIRFGQFVNLLQEAGYGDGVPLNDDGTAVCTPPQGTGTPHGYLMARGNTP